MLLTDCSNLQYVEEVISLNIVMNEPLKNERWENFARYLAKGMDVLKAYHLSGFRGSRINACRLRRRPQVKARINYWQDRNARQAGVTHETIAMRFNQIYEAALEDGELNTARLAAADLGKLYGLFTEKIETNVNANVVTEIQLVAPEENED